jgi:hypothetical protein
VSDSAPAVAAVEPAEDASVDSNLSAFLDRASPAPASQAPEEAFDYEDPAVIARQHADKAPADDSAAKEPAADAAPTKQSPPADTAASKVEFPADLLAEATTLGLDPADFESPLHLERSVAAIDKSLAKLGRQRQETTEQPSAPAAKQPEPAAKPAPAPSPVVDDFKLNLNPDLVDETVAAELQRMNQHHAGKVAELQAKFDALVAGTQRQQSSKSVEEVDSFVANLGDAWEPVFGKGDFAQVQANAPAFGNRSKLFDAAAAIAKGYAANGLPVPSPAVCLKKALGAEFSEHNKTIAARQLTADVKKRQSQFTNRPTQRGSGDVLSPEKKAASRIDSFFKDRGASDV